MKLRAIFLLLPLFLVLSILVCVSHFLFKDIIIWQIFSLAALLWIPGFLTTLVFKFKTNDTWQFLLHSLGFSIIWIYLVSLISSLTFQYIGISRPLDFNSISLLIYGLSVFLFVLALVRNWKETITFHELGKQLVKLLLYLFVIATSALGILGAFQLNNGGSNVLSISWLIFLVILVFSTSLTNNKYVVVLRPYLVFTLSMSLLWMLSARSNHLIGWDIMQEYGVASATSNAGKWSMNEIKSAYNACLSITILPSVITSITLIPIETLYKFLYPYIFAHFPVIIYIWLSKLTNKNWAFLSVIYILAQPFFIQPMVGLARQEVAFFFFGMLLLTIYSRVLSKKTQVFAVILYLFALVTSHYSTTYVTVLLFTMAYLIILFLFLFRKLPLPKRIKSLDLYQNWLVKYFSSLKWWMVITLIAFTYIWYFLVTQVGSNVTSTISGSISGMAQLFSGEQKSQEVQSALPGGSTANVSSEADIKYFEHSSDQILGNITTSKVQQIFRDYPLYPYAEQYIPSTINKSVANNINKSLNYVKDALKILLIVGAFIQFCRTFRNSKQNLDLTLYSCVGVFVLLVMILHPTLGLRYNISRIYLQLMVFVSISLIIGINTLLWKLPDKVKMLIMSSVLCVSLLYMHGAFTPVTGGIPLLHFYNVGTEYEKSYFFQGELSAARWLQDHRNYKNTVYGDDFAGLRLIKEASFFPNTQIIPAVLENNSEGYVYLTNTNKQLAISRVNFLDKLLTYSYPVKYLNDERNLIYSNNFSRVYR